MVIFSACICDKLGKLIISRQFTQVTRRNLEEQVLTFPKLIHSSQQHTFVEINNIRYVYLHLDQFFLLVITNRTSNIIEDLETLNLLHKLIVEICQTITLEKLKNKAFKILMIIDDLIALGYREGVTSNQIKNSLQMESSEEKLAIMFRKARENEAKEQAKQHQNTNNREVLQRLKEGKGSKMENIESQSNIIKENLEIIKSSEKDVIKEDKLSTMVTDQIEKEIDAQKYVQISKQEKFKQRQAAPKKGMKLGQKQKIKNEKKVQLEDNID